MKTWQAVLFGVLCGLLAVVILRISVTPPKGEMVILRPAPTIPPYLIHITGEVKTEGVYSLPRGSRLEDLIHAAGGLTENANDEAINLTYRLNDGEKIHIPAKTDEKNGNNLPTNSSGDQAIAQIDLKDASGLVDINTASSELLQSLPGIGPVTADKIIAYRQENGPFSHIQHLLDVPGIGPATLERINSLITISNSP